MTHPHSAILAACTGPVALFADFDGTLVEIAPTPAAVHVPDNLGPLLDRVDSALDGAFAIVTGRAIADIDGFLPSSRIAISGSHGAEHRHNGTTTQPDPALREVVADIASHVQEAMGDDDRILIETKPAGVALHFRAAPQLATKAREAINAAVSGRPEFHVVAGKKVFEARPHSANKGAAVKALADQPPFAGRLPVFIGDDVTDEDGFVAAHRLGGFGVKVGQGETAARFRLEGVSAVYELLDALAQNQTQTSVETKSNPPKESMVK